MRISTAVLGLSGLAAITFVGTSAGQAATVNQQCGQQYQAAKAAATLNGQTWAQFRSDCAAKLKAEPASATTAAPAPAATDNPLNPTPAAAPAAPASTTTTAATPAAAAPATGGKAALVTRERACGAEWRANKVTLVAQTPGLTWPKYWHECNTRMKAAGK